MTSSRKTLSAMGSKSCPRALVRKTYGYCAIDDVAGGRGH